MTLLNGIKTSSKIQTLLKSKLYTSGKLKLAVILIGNNPASVTYVHMKKKKCESLGINCDILNFKSDVNEEKLLTTIETLNKDKTVTGILVQLPLPIHINTRKVLDCVDIKKDVDGLNSYHLMKILLNEEKIVPCTPKGIIRLLEEYNIPLEGKNVCVIGFSDVVGKPLATMCLNRGATVTVCNSKTKNLKQHTLNSDIIMSAVGKPNLIKANMIKKDSIVVDIGVSRINGKIVGDVDFETVKEKCSYITPVPGGVGPMTIISLIENLIELGY